MTLTKLLRLPPININWARMNFADLHRYVVYVDGKEHARFSSPACADHTAQILEAPYSVRILDSKTMVILYDREESPTLAAARIVEYMGLTQ